MLRFLLAALTAPCLLAQFLPTTGFTAGPGLRATVSAFVTAADLNCDGKVDLITGTVQIDGNGNAAVVAFLGDGRGGYGNPISSPFSGWADTVTVADLDG